MAKVAEQDIHGYEGTHFTNLTGFTQTFITNVFNQLASDYSLANGGDPGQTAVGNAYSANVQSLFTADLNFANGEEAAYENYADQESARRQTANDNLATAAQTWTNSVSCFPAIVCE